MTEQKMIKGTMVIDVIKAMRFMKDVPWKNYLSNEARELTSQRILPSLWYPYEPALECLATFFKIAGKSNPDLARKWGKDNGGRLFESIYQTIFSDNSGVIDTMKKFDVIVKSSFVKGVKIDSEQLNPRHFMIKIEDDDPRSEPIYYFIEGWFDAIIGKTGGKNVKVFLMEKHWEGKPATVFSVRWE